MRIAATTIIFCVSALVTLGVIILYSATKHSSYLENQLIGLTLGLVSCLVVTCVDYKYLKWISIPLVLVTIVLLELVLIEGIGLERNGARRWIIIAGQNFQPSEVAKLALVIGLAHYAERYSRFMTCPWRGLFIPGCVIIYLLLRIFVEPDRGATILLAAVAAAMLLVGGVQWRHIIPPLAVGAIGLAYSLATDPMRLKRILSWCNLEETKDDTGYQAWQARLALGSGGWFGLGLGNGRQKLGFIPEHHTDFILSIIGEELGLLATLSVILAFMLIIGCGIYIAWRARDNFGFMLASGVTFLIGLQAFINIGVVSGALPNKGLPLPFISYGGSNLLVMLTCIGLLMNVAIRSMQTADSSSNVFSGDELVNPQFS
jgi:cell division protein FtsW